MVHQFFLPRPFRAQSVTMTPIHDLDRDTPTALPIYMQIASLAQLPVLLERASRR